MHLTADEVCTHKAIRLIKNKLLFVTFNMILLSLTTGIQ